MRELLLYPEIRKEICYFYVQSEVMNMGKIPSVLL